MKYIFNILRGFFGTVLLLTACFGVVYLMLSFALITSIGDNVNDTLSYRLQYQNNTHPGDIVIIKIDDKSLDSIGKSDLGMLAFDKGVYADGVKNIFEVYEAGVVGIDIVFANPSVLGEQDEQKLSQTLNTYKDRVVIASRSDYTPHPLCIYSDVSHGIVNINSTQKIRSFDMYFPDYDISPYCPKNSISLENTNGVYSFAGEILQKYSSVISPIEANLVEKGFQKFQEISDRGNKIFIEYFYAAGDYSGTLGYESYSFSDILEGKTIDERGKKIDLKNKIVLIGEVGTIMHDSHFTPISRNIKMPGVEINANIVSTLMSAEPLRVGNIYLSFFVYIFTGMILIFSVFHFRFFFAFVSLLFSIIVIIIFGGWMFYLGEIYNMFHIIFAIILAYIIAYIYRFQITDKSKRNLKKSFSLYVSPDVVHEITQNPKSVSTSGQIREMSIFFSDIVSFTSISESTKPEMLLELLNEYFSQMTGILLKNKGTLDKYIGDAIMGFFNAPVLQENHSYYACLTAVQQQAKLRELNTIWSEKGYPHIAIRIGIHTGEAIHGNIGSLDTRLNYTVIGDSVNLASRLEAIGKRYGIYTCVSQDVYDLQKEMFHFRQLDKITVKGKKIPVTIYELIALKSDGDLAQEKQEQVKKYEKALYLYYDKQYLESIEILKTNSQDTPSNKLLERCKDVLSGNIEIHQGVFVMNEK